MKLRLVKIETYKTAFDETPAKVEFWIEHQVCFLWIGLWWSRSTNQPFATENEAKNFAKDLCSECFYEYKRQGHSENLF